MQLNLTVRGLHSTNVKKQHKVKNTRVRQGISAAFDILKPTDHVFYHVRRHVSDWVRGAPFKFKFEIFIVSTASDQ